MQIILNSHQYELENAIYVTELLEQLGLNGRLAVEINQQIIPRSQFETHQILAGDKIEIVHAVGGG